MDDPYLTCRSGNRPNRGGIVSPITGRSAHTTRGRSVTGDENGELIKRTMTGVIAESEGWISPETAARSPRVGIF